MKIIQYLLLFFLIFPQYAKTADIHAPKLKEQLNLPSKIIKTLELDKKDIEELWGKPDRKSKGKYYYEVDNYRFRLILTFEEEKKTRLRYVFDRGKGRSFEDFEEMKSIDPQNPSLYPKHGHEKSRFIKAEVLNEDGHWSLFFHNNSKRRLHYIVWKKSP